MELDWVGRVLRLFGRRPSELLFHEPEVVHRVSESFRVTDPATGRVQTFSDRNEIPDSLRQALEQAELSRNGSANGSETVVETHHEFHVADGDGSVRVYQSLDEMPPEIRRLFG